MSQDLLCLYRQIRETPALTVDFPENTLAVLSLLRKAADDGAAVLLVTHENEAAQFADQVYTMDGGELVES